MQESNTKRIAKHYDVMPHNPCYDPVDCNCECAGCVAAKVKHYGAWPLRDATPVICDECRALRGYHRCHSTGAATSAFVRGEDSGHLCECARVECRYARNESIAEEETWKVPADLGPVWDSTGYLYNPKPHPVCANCGLKKYLHRSEGLIGCVHLLVKELNRLNAMPTESNGWWLISDEDVNAVRRSIRQWPQASVLNTNKALHALETGLHLTRDIPGDFR